MIALRGYFAVGFLLAAAVAAFAADVKVVANPSLRANSISIAELRSIFMLQRRPLKDGSLLEPVLTKNSATTDTFMKKYLNRDSEEVYTYYQGLVFTGKASMPKQLNSDAEIIAYVARTKGAIGYVSADAVTEQVKVLLVSETPPAPRTLLTRVEPEYPETLQHLGIGGTVRLEVTISPKGSVENASVLGGNPILAEAATKAVKQWVYSASSSTTKLEVIVPFDPQH